MMTIDTIFDYQDRPARRPAGAVFDAVLTALRRQMVARRTRRALIEMSDEQLRDIGITRRQAQDEAAKSWFWD